MSLENGGTWHTLSAMLLYQWRRKSAGITRMTSYWCLSDVTEISFCQGTKHTSYNCYGNRSMSSSQSHMIRGEHGILCMPCSFRIIGEMLYEIHLMKKKHDFLKCQITTEVPPWNGKPRRKRKQTGSKRTQYWEQNTFITILRYWTSQVVILCPWPSWEINKYKYTIKNK